jgi:hypothetical protein
MEFTVRYRHFGIEVRCGEQGRQAIGKNESVDRVGRGNKDIGNFIVVKGAWAAGNSSGSKIYSYRHSIN